MFEEDYRIASMLARKTQISTSKNDSKVQAKKQEKEREYVIKAWNSGESMEDIAHHIKKNVHYVNKYLKRFEYFYGKEAVRGRNIPLVMSGV